MANSLVHRQRVFVSMRPKTSRFAGSCKACADVRTGLTRDQALAYVAEHEGHAGVWVTLSRPGKGARHG